MGKKAKKTDQGKNQSKKAKQGKKAKQSKQRKGGGSSKSKRSAHKSEQHTKNAWKPRIALKGHWSDELQRWVYPFEVPWEQLGDSERAAARHLHSLERSRTAESDVKAWWQQRLQQWRSKRLPDPLGFDADLLKYSVHAPSKELCIAQARLGLLWQEAQLAGFGLLHAAFKPLLKSVCISSACENEQDWALFTSPGQSRRRSIDADACSLCYWEVHCPQVKCWGFCEWGDHCPFSLSMEEVACHPAVALCASAHRRAASRWMPSFESRFGQMAVTVLQNPHLLACNAFWPRSCVVVAVDVAEAAPIVELSVRQATPMGPGHSGLVEKRYLVLPALCQWDFSEAVLMSQLPARDVLKPPVSLKCIAGSTWACVKLRLGALHGRLSFLGLTAGHTSIDLKNAKPEHAEGEAVDEHESEDLEDDDDEDDDFDEDDALNLVRSLKAVLQSGSQVPCPKREETVSSELLAQHMKWYAWKEWKPARPWAGANAGTWSQVAGQYFGVSTRHVCGRPKRFAQQVPGISIWNNKGSAYLYPTPVFRFLNRFSEVDIKWASTQLEKGEGLHEGSMPETEQECDQESDEEVETERPVNAMTRLTDNGDLEEDSELNIHDEASETEDVCVAGDVESLYKDLTMTGSHQLPCGLSMGWPRLDLLPQRAMQRVFHFFSWADFSATQMCTACFLRLVLRWQNGQWVRERSVDCNVTRMITSTLRARHSFQERGGTCASIRRHRAKRKAEQHSKLPQLESGNVSSIPAACSNKVSAEVGSQHASGMSDRIEDLAVEPHSLRHPIQRISFILDMPPHFVDGDSKELLLWQMCRLLQCLDSWNLMGVSESYRRRLVRLGLHASLFTVLGQLLELPKDESEQAVENVLRTLAKMAFVHSRRNTQQSRMGPRILLNLDRTKLLLKCTRRFASNELIGAWVLRFLAAVVYNCDESKSVFNEAGGIDILVSILVQHDGEESVLLAGMSAVANLTFVHEKRDSERIFGYVPPTLGSTYRLCERLFTYTDSIDPEVVVVKTYQATSAPKSSAGKGSKRKSSLPPEVRVSVIYVKDSSSKWEARHMHVLVRTTVFDGDLLCHELDRAAAKHFPNRSLKGYVVVLFFTSQEECKMLRRGLHRLPKQIGGLYCCPRAAKSHAAHKARDGRGLEVWLLRARWDCEITADLPLHDLIPNEGTCMEQAPVMNQCFDALQQVSVVLQRLKSMAQGARDALVATQDDAATKDVELSAWQQETIQKIDAELEEATNHCTLCQSDVSDIRNLLKEPDRGMWAKVLLILEPKYESVPVRDIRFLHGGISSRFLHGRHAGQPITQLVEDLRSKCTEPCELNIELVKWHGQYRTLRHRRVWALKQWAAEIEGTSSCIVTFSARVLPLVADVRDIDGHRVVRKFFRAYSTENDGTSVEIRGKLPAAISTAFVQRPLATPAKNAPRGVEHHGAANSSDTSNRGPTAENRCNQLGGAASSLKAGQSEHVSAHRVSGIPVTDPHVFASTMSAPRPVFPMHPIIRPMLPGYPIQMRPPVWPPYNMQVPPRLGPPANVGLHPPPPPLAPSQPSSFLPPPPPLPPASVHPTYLPPPSSLAYPSSDLLLPPASMPVLPLQAITSPHSDAHARISMPSIPMNQSHSNPVCKAVEHPTAALQKAPSHVQKQLIGQALLEKIRTREPALATKLTGMCLESENAMLLDVLQDDLKMWQMVDQALMTLVTSRRDVPEARQLISHMSLDSRQRVIGMHFHRLASGFRPDQANKVTGMLLQLDVDAVAELLVSQALLHAKIEEALVVLQDLNHGQPAHKGSR